MSKMIKSIILKLKGYKTTAARGCKRRGRYKIHFNLIVRKALRTGTKINRKNILQNRGSQKIIRILLMGWHKMENHPTGSVRGTYEYHPSKRAKVWNVVPIRTAERNASKHCKAKAFRVISSLIGKIFSSQKINLCPVSGHCCPPSFPFSRAPLSVSSSCHISWSKKLLFSFSGFFSARQASSSRIRFCSSRTPFRTSARLGSAKRTASLKVRLLAIFSMGTSASGPCSFSSARSRTKYASPFSGSWSRTRSQ